MNYTNSVNIGIDKLINSIQKDLYKELINRWVNDINGYGRLYRNENSRDKRRILERHVKGSEYEDVYLNDNVSGNFFFFDTDTHKSKDQFVFNTKVKCVFMVNLAKILSDPEGRPDEEAHRDAIEILRNISNERYKVIELETGTLPIFEAIDRDDLKHTNLNPYHVFSVVLDVNYYFNDKCD